MIVHLHLNTFDYDSERFPIFFPAFDRHFPVRRRRRRRRRWKDDFHRRSRLSPIFPPSLYASSKEGKERSGSAASLRLSLENETQYSEAGVGTKQGWKSRNLFSEKRNAISTGDAHGYVYTLVEKREDASKLLRIQWEQYIDILSANLPRTVIWKRLSKLFEICSVYLFLR